MIWRDSKSRSAFTKSAPRKEFGGWRSFCLDELYGTVFGGSGGDHPADRPRRSRSGGGGAGRLPGGRRAAVYFGGGRKRGQRFARGERLPQDLRDRGICAHR